jgi:hypothetical protein
MFVYYLVSKIDANHHQFPEPLHGNNISYGGNFHLEGFIARAIDSIHNLMPFIKVFWLQNSRVIDGIYFCVANIRVTVSTSWLDADITSLCFYFTFFFFFSRLGKRGTILECWRVARDLVMMCNTVFFFFTSIIIVVRTLSVAYHLIEYVLFIIIIIWC